jgi:hypothetical protein
MTTNQEKLTKIQRLTNAVSKILVEEQTPDHRLNADQLAARYSPTGNGEHPKHTRDAWREELFRDNNLLLGYWDWVAHQLHVEFIHSDQSK